MSQQLQSRVERPFVMALGLDLSDQVSGGYAFDEALRMASRIPRSHMHVVYVVGPDTSEAATQEAVGLLRLYVADKARALGLQGPQRAGLHVRRGDPAREIAQLAADVGADAIVVGTHKPAMLRSLFVGSTVERLMSAAGCPVFVAGPRPRPQPPHIIVIEGPCPDCVQARFASDGATWWCARHSEPHHLRRHHVYSYHSELPFEDHDYEVNPADTGA
jgi:nucleotide-binding universal stress UspA family protein